MDSNKFNMNNGERMTIYEDRPDQQNNSTLKNAEDSNAESIIN